MKGDRVKLSFGRHEGELITRVPVSYLKWMVREDTSQAKQAEEELKRRGTETPDLEVSGHAIDRFSQRHLKLWLQHQKDEVSPVGLWTFIHRLAREAVRCAGRRKPGEPKDDLTVNHRGVRWVFALGGAWPVVKTVT